MGNFKFECTKLLPLKYNLMQRSVQEQSSSCKSLLPKKWKRKSQRWQAYIKSNGSLTWFCY